MASMIKKFKKMPKRNKKYALGIMGLISLGLILGIQSTYAYYHEEKSLPILAAAVGDFDTGDGDINIMIYKQSEDNNKLYSRTYSVPAFGYEFNDELTKCTVTCSEDGEGNCRYNYNENDRTFSLTSKEKVTCKFYFDQKEPSDVNIYIMLADDNGPHYYDGKRYSIVNMIPPVGYTYDKSVCENNSDKLEYDEATHKFTLSTNSKDKCYAYFNKSDVPADISSNIYVQSEKDSKTYINVKTIPAGKLYNLNEEKSMCKDVGATDKNSSTIKYEDGYINILSSGKETCDIYLDLADSTTVNP